MPYFEHGGVRLRYELAGPDDGVPTFLLHGFASSFELNWVGSRWQETLSSAGRLVIGLDQRGHGLSDKPHDAELYQRQLMAEDVTALLGHLAVKEADVIGYSMGAQVALSWAAIGGAAGRIVLGGLGTFRGFTGSETIARRLLGDESVHDPVAESFYAFASTRTSNDLEALAACIVGKPVDLSPEVLRRIRNHVLVVVGDQDALVTGGRELASQMPEARYLELRDRDHLTAITSGEFKRAALEFLEGG